MLDEQLFDRRYQLLNPQQREAVDAIEGPVLVVAGPGSGKTELLSMRVANILRQTDTPASAILCLTFTESAALNMRKRLRSIIGPQANSLAIHTFHSFGAEIINQNAQYFFFGKGFQPADDLATIAILETILSQLPVHDPLAVYHEDLGWTYRSEIQSRISDLKKAGVTPAEFAEILDDNQKFLDQVNPLLVAYFENYQNQQLVRNWDGLIQQIGNLSCPDGEYSYKTVFLAEMQRVAGMIANSGKLSTTPITEWKNRHFKKDAKNRLILKDLDNQPKYRSLARIYQAYQLELHARELYDFDDMLLEVLMAFEKYPELRYTYQEQFLYILVDEFQDTSGVQTKILDQLVNLEVTDGRPNLMVVGDDDQAIYKFQGASLDNLLAFRRKYRDVKVVTLIQNYRSKQTILDLAGLIIDNCAIRLARAENLDKTLVSQV